MAIPFYLNNALDKNTNTFGDWFARTNQISQDMGSKILSAELSSSGGTTTGNTSLDGIFSANTVAVGTELRGGTLQTSAPLTISSNTVFSGQSTTFNTNEHLISSNTVVVSSSTFSSTCDSISFTAANINMTGDTTMEKLNIQGTNAIKLPVGTTAQRPTGLVGHFRFNSSTGAFEGYDGTNWNEIGISSGDSSIDGNLTVSGTSSLATVSTSGNVSIGGTLTVAGKTTLSSSLTINSSDFIKIPTGIDSQRPGTPQAGMLRFNSTISSFEGYDGTEWGEIGADTSITISDDTTTNAARYLPFVNTNSGIATDLTVSSTKLFFNPSSGSLNATGFNSLSDIKHKENIEAILDADSILKNINTYTFNWKHDGTKSYGVIAQEFENKMPELVNENDGTKYVNYTPLIPVLIEAYKSLSEKLNKLENE